MKKKMLKHLIFYQLYPQFLTIVPFEIAHENNLLNINIIREIKIKNKNTQTPHSPPVASVEMILKTYTRPLHFILLRFEKL